MLPVIASALQRQLSGVRPLVEDVAAGRGALVIVEGLPGTGRSLAVDRIADLARRAGLRTAVARAAYGDEVIPFAVVDALAEALDVKISAASGSTAVEPTAVAAVGARLLEAAQPAEHSAAACLLVDDAQFADEASLRTLLHLARRLRDRGVVLVVACGPDTISPLVAVLLDELRATPGAALVRLGALDREDAAFLAKASLGRDADPETLERRLHRTGGNPLLLTALLEDARLEAGQPNASAEAVPARVRAWVTTRLSRLGTAAVALARAVQVLGDEATLLRTAALGQLDRRVAEDAADDLVRVGLLRAGPTLRFPAPLVGDAVAAGMEPFRADRMHREAAAILAVEHLPAQVVARHLVATSPAGQPWIADQLRAAAQQVLSAGNCATAATWLRRAVAEPPGADDVPEVLAELAFAESRAGLPEAADRIDDALAAATAPDARVMLLRERSRVMWLTGRVPAAVEASAAALAESGPGSALQDELLADLLAVASMHDLSPIYAQPALVELLERASTGWVPDSAALAATLAAVLPFVLGDHRLVGPLVDRATREDLWRADVPPFGLRPDFVIGSLWLTDQLARGTEVIGQGFARIGGGDSFRHGLLHYWLGEVRYAAGDLPGAIEAAGTALHPCWGPFVNWFGFSSATLVNAHLDLDDPHRAAQVLATTDGRVEPHQLTGIDVDLARARLELRTGRATNALGLVASVSERLQALGHRDGPQITWRPVAATAAAALGEAERARSLAEEEVVVARSTHAVGRLGRALLTKAHVVDPTDRFDVLQEAVDVLATSERRLEHARALLALGVELHERRDVPAARAVLAEARALAERCGAAPLANRALTALHATGARPRRTARTGLDSLTAAERRVVELAAEGRTNREIGALLHIRPRTVEWHLGRAFAKLGVQSRRDLPRALERRPD